MPSLSEINLAPLTQKVYLLVPIDLTNLSNILQRSYIKRQKATRGAAVEFIVTQEAGICITSHAVQQI